MCNKSADLGRSGREQKEKGGEESQSNPRRGRSDPVFNVLGAEGEHPLDSQK